MAAEESQQYEITWAKKPLGFSIVMDTTGRNAYVSSIQKQENLTKGLKLAAQIIKINGQDAKQKKHGAILELIKQATLPMTLTFQPRSFASSTNNAAESGEDEAEKQRDAVSSALLFGGAPESAKNRVDGLFLKVKNAKTNGRHMWQRKDRETDPIMLWYWPLEGGDAGPSGMQENLWMISRKSQLNTQHAYACCPSEELDPLNIKKKWKVWNQTEHDFVSCALSIADQVSGTEEEW